MRLKIVERIAGIAATNTHWYQELPYGQRAESIYRHAEYLQGQYGVPGALYELKGEKRPPSSPDASAWRRVKHIRPRVGPRPEDVGYLAKVSFGRHWSAVTESRRCPACNRTKLETVRKSNKGDWTFLLSDRSFYAPGERYGSKRAVVCGDCGRLASDRGKEACRFAEAATESNYAQFLSVSEIALVVFPQPHARHNVKNDVADDLVMDLVERITLLEQQDG